MLSKSQMRMWGLLLFSVVVRPSSVLAKWLTHVYTHMFTEGMSELGWFDEPLMHSICINSDKNKSRIAIPLSYFKPLAHPAFISLCAFRQKTAD